MRGSLAMRPAPARLSRTLFTSRALPPPRTRLGSALRVTVFGAVLVGGYLYISDSRAGFHRWIAVPLLHLATKDDPELAHRIGVEGLKWNSRIGLVKDRGVDEKSLEVEVRDPPLSLHWLVGMLMSGREMSRSGARSCPIRWAWRQDSTSTAKPSTACTTLASDTSR